MVAPPRKEIPSIEGIGDATRFQRPIIVSCSRKAINLCGLPDFKKSWHPELSILRDLRNHRALVDVEKKVDADGSDLNIFFTDSDNTASAASRCDIEIIRDFCRDISLEDVARARGRAGQWRSVWLDDRSSIPDLKGSGVARQYVNPLTATGLYQALKRQRFNHIGLPDAARRLIYITDLDPACIHALAATASCNQVLVLRNAIYRHLHFQTSIAVSFPSNGVNVLTFELDLHLPFFLLRDTPPEEPVGKVNTKPRRSWIDLSFLKLATSESQADEATEVWGIYEAHISCVITGSDDWRWVGYGFVDAEIDGVLHDSSEDDLAFDQIASGALEANVPIWRPRDYWLQVFEIRIKQVLGEWEYLIHKMELPVYQYAYKRLLILSGRSGIAQEDAEIKEAFDWTVQMMGLLCRFRSVLSNIIDAWNSFSASDGDISYFRPTDATRISSNARRSLNTIRAIFRQLEGIQKKINDLNKCCSEFKGSMSQILQSHALSADSASSVVSSYALSIFSDDSIEFPSSQNSAEELPPAANELVALLVNDVMLKPLYSAALENPRIGAHQFENNFRDLLKQYSAGLKDRARDTLQKEAAQLVWSHARYVANTIRRKFDPKDNREMEQMEQMRQLQFQRPDQTKLEMLDRYLQRTRINGGVSEAMESNELTGDPQNDQSPVPTTWGVNMNDEVQSSKEGDLDEHDSIYPPSLEPVKLFMVSGDAFESLRVKFRQFVHPHSEPKQSDALNQREEDPSNIDIMTATTKECQYEENTNQLEEAWRKQDDIRLLNCQSPPKAILLNDNGRILRFTPRTLTPSLGLIDQAKEIVERWLWHPINWWPLEPRKTRCPEDHTRISWFCGCGAELYVDFPTDVAKEYSEQCASVTLASAGQSLLPMHNTVHAAVASGASAQSQKNEINPSSVIQRSSQQQKSEPITNDPEVGHAERVQTISKLSDLFLHWCVDVNKYETRLFHIPILGMNDLRIIHELKSAYSAVGGFRRWFSLTACYGIKFVKFERVHRSRELVACGEEDLPCPKTNQDYIYTYVDPREQFTKTLEKSLIHHFHNPHGCSAQDIEDVLSRIPKKINGKLEKTFGAAGYGMHAVPGWALWKLFVALILSQIGPLVFAIRWLCGHPGDLQNAFTLSMYLVGLLNLVVVVPDIWSMQR